MVADLIGLGKHAGREHYGGVAERFFDSAVEPFAPVPVDKSEPLGNSMCIHAGDVSSGFGSFLSFQRPLPNRSQPFWYTKKASRK